MMRTREQDRSKSALDFVRGTTLDSNQVADLKSLPGKIQINGLLAVVAYLDKKQPKIEDALRQWLGTRDGLTKYLTGCTGQEYARLTEEALAYAKWLKHWATADQEEKDVRKKQSGGSHGPAEG